MKIGVSSYSFSKLAQGGRFTYTEMCDAAKSLGYDGIEFVTLERADMAVDERKAASEIREHCAKIGLDVVSYTVGANLLGDDPKGELKTLCARIDVAAELGAKTLRHDISFKPSRPARYPWQKMAEEAAPLIREATEYAATKGIRTCTENHGHLFQDAERVEALIEEVGSDNFGWLVDMGNFLCVDADPPSSVAVGARYAFHAHVKDFLYKPASATLPAGKGGWLATRNGNYLRGTVLGHGVVPIEQCVNILRTAGYDGYLDVEFEGWEDVLQALGAAREYLRAIGL